MFIWLIDTVFNHSPVLSGGVSAPRLPILMEWSNNDGTIPVDWGSAGRVEW